MNAEQVEQIVKQVLAEMSRQGAAARTAAAQVTATAAQATITAPQARPTADAAQPVKWTGPTYAVPNWTRRAAKPEQASPRRRFITADMLLGRIAAAGKGPVELGADEFLTPNARDLLDRKAIAVTRAQRQAFPPAAIAALPAAAPAACALSAAGAATHTSAAAQVGATGLVVHRADQKVTSLLDSLARQGVALCSFAATDCPIANFKALCGAISAGSARAGIVLVPYGAISMVLAGKFAGVRPVQATRLESVQSALRQFAANLLVVEHAFSTFHEMRAMVQCFIAGVAAAQAAAPLAREIETLEKR